MDKKLKYLIDILREAELHSEAHELNQLLIKSASLVDEQIASWQAVIEEVDRPYDIQPQGKAIRWMVLAAKNLADASEGLKGSSPEEIEEAAKTVEKVTKANNQSIENIKNGSVLGLIGKATPMLSLLIALKNLYYSFEEFKKIQEDAPKIGLNWMDTLQPSKMKAKAQELYDSPEELEILARLTKSTILFGDEAISGVVNLVDGIKDILFIAIDVLSFGGAAIVDFGISMLLWLAVEWPAEKAFKAAYNPILTGIKSTAELSIQSLIQQKAPAPKDLQEEVELPEEDLDVWWESLA